MRICLKFESSVQFNFCPYYPSPEGNGLARDNRKKFQMTVEYAQFFYDFWMSDGTIIQAVSG